MAEALLNARGQGKIEAYSAGSTPAGFVHPGSLAALDRQDVPYGSPSSQSWDECAGQSFDVVITVCDSAAAETCPVFDSVFKQLDARVRSFVTESVG
jgi:arsenate reductase